MHHILLALLSRDLQQLLKLKESDIWLRTDEVGEDELVHINSLIINGFK